MKIISKLKLFVAIWVQVMEIWPTAARMFKVYNLSRNFKKTIFFGSISEFWNFLKLKKLRKKPEKTPKKQEKTRKLVRNVCFSGFTLFACSRCPPDPMYFHLHTRLDWHSSESGGRGFLLLYSYSRVFGHKKSVDTNLMVKAIFVLKSWVLETLETALFHELKVFSQN